MLETGEEFCALRLCELETSITRKRSEARKRRTTPTPRRIPFPFYPARARAFVCYAEKTHGPTLLKHISAVKSPQAVMGTIVKSHVAEALGVAPDALFHASVMPCFDKKLEASRADFSRDVAVPEGGDDRDASGRTAC